MKRTVSWRDAVERLRPTASARRSPRRQGPPTGSRPAGPRNRSPQRWAAPLLSPLPCQHRRFLSLPGSEKLWQVPVCGQGTRLFAEPVRPRMKIRLPVPSVTRTWRGCAQPPADGLKEEGGPLPCPAPCGRTTGEPGKVQGHSRGQHGSRSPSCCMEATAVLDLSLPHR